MKPANAKPLVTIWTYEERQEELSKAIVMRDEVDHVATNGHANTDIQQQLQQFPTPPPPPQFANAPMSPQKSNTMRRQISHISNEPPELPTPDYDLTPTHTLPKHRGLNTTGFMNGTLKRVAATEAKTNGDAAELESLESFKLKNPSSPIPRPPSLYFAAQSSGPPTMKKLSKSVSVTIGEYGGAQNCRKEPSKFAFISKMNENCKTLPNPNSQNHNQKDENVSEMLRSELEKTLSRSNLKKKNEVQNGVVNHNNNNNNNSNNNISINHNNSIPSPPPKMENVVFCMTNNKPVLQKTQSSNIEKLTNMLQNKQLLLETNNTNRTDTMKSANKVTISIPNKQELRKTESTPITPTNGILKNGYSKSNYGDKNITFGN